MTPSKASQYWKRGSSLALLQRRRQTTLPKSPPGRPLRGLPDGSTPSPLASTASYRPSAQLGSSLSWTKFLLEKFEGLTHSAAAVVTPHRGVQLASLVHPGQLGQTGVPAKQRRPQSYQGVLGVCVPVCMADAQGWTGGGGGSVRRVGCPGGPGVVPPVSPCPPQANTQPSGALVNPRSAVETVASHH